MKHIIRLIGQSWVLLAVLLVCFWSGTSRAESIMEQLDVASDATKCVTISGAYAQGMWFYGEGYDDPKDFPLPEKVIAGTEDATFFMGLATAGWKTMKSHIEAAHQADADKAKGTEWEGKITFNRAQASLLAQSVFHELAEACNAGGQWFTVKALLNLDDETMKTISRLLNHGSRI